MPGGAEYFRHSDQSSLILFEDDIIGDGGEATIYSIDGVTDLAAKIYRNAPPSEYAIKLALMLERPPKDPMAKHGHHSFAWPSDLLWTRGNTPKIAGFLMPRVHGFRGMSEYSNPAARKRGAPLFHYGYAIRAAANLSSAIQALHARGYVVGDVNESNVLVADTALITLVDVDSFQVSHPRIYRCNVGKPEFTPPELHGKAFSDITRTTEHDHFGLGVLIFQLLMQGLHPHAGRFLGSGDPTVSDRICAGYFAYSRKRAVPIERPDPILFESLAPAIQGLFARCFDDGHLYPSARPSPAEWHSVMEAEYRSLKSCSVNSQHLYHASTRSCPWCARKSRMSSVDPFPSIADVRNGRHLQRPKQKPPVSNQGGLLVAPIQPANQIASHIATQTLPGSPSISQAAAFQPPLRGFSPINWNATKFAGVVVAGLLAYSLLSDFRSRSAQPSSTALTQSIPAGLYSDPTWLYAQQDWNNNASVPYVESKRDPGCGKAERTAESNVEKALAERGWLLPGYPSTWTEGSTTIVAAMQSTDLNCRAVGMAYFVFANPFIYFPRFIGTLAPVPLESFSTRVVALKVHENSLTVTYAFRSQSDPRCCMGFQSTAEYSLSSNSHLTLRSASKIQILTIDEWNSLRNL